MNVCNPDRTTRHAPAFALPTILIISTVMLIILAGAATSVGSIRAALNSQYYNLLATEAAESGLAAARSCLAQSNYVATWGSGTSSLRPNTGCTGGAACVNTSSCFVLSKSDMRTTFAVEAPTSSMAGSQVVTVTGTVQLMRTSNSTLPWKTYTQTLNARVGAEVGFNNVVFGYTASGAYFLTQGLDSVVRGTGYNGQGQLGVGSYGSVTTPREMLSLPGSARPVSIHTSFVSLGLNTFVIGSDNNLYGMGQNTHGQLGNGSMTTTSIPVRFQLPAGQKPINVALLGFATLVQTDTGNIYSVGYCDKGQLGYNYTIAGCTNQSTYKRVNLPTVVSSNPNTKPTTNLVVDGSNAYVRMEGGMVYGWGYNFFNRLGPNSTDGVDSSNPVVLGTFGVGSNPKAEQVAFDGEVVYVLDSTGKVTTFGRSMYGSKGTQRIRLMSEGYCMDNKSSNGLDMQTYYCNDSAAQEYTPNASGAISAKIAGVDRCLAAVSAVVGSVVRLVTCTPSSMSQPVLQRFTRGADQLIRSEANTSLCIQATQLTSLKLATCSASTNSQKWSIYDLPGMNYSADRMTYFDIPASAGRIVKIATDQWSTAVLTNTGQVWGAGQNDHGQLGLGAVRGEGVYLPGRFILPAGVTATDVMTTAVGGISPTNYYSNIYVIGSDGKVYGAGSNFYGQLGMGGSNYTDQATPVPMVGIGGPGNPRAVSVQAGFGTAVVLTDNGKIYTVGNNSSGQLGDGTTTKSATPKVNQYTNIIPSTTF